MAAQGSLDSDDEPVPNNEESPLQSQVDVDTNDGGASSPQSTSAQDQGGGSISESNSTVENFDDDCYGVRNSGTTRIPKKRRRVEEASTRGPPEDGMDVGAASQSSGPTPSTSGFRPATDTRSDCDSLSAKWARLAKVTSQKSEQSAPCA